MYTKEENEFVVLGQKLTLNGPEDSLEDISPEEVVTYLNREADMIREKSPGLQMNQVAILTALKIASEKLAMEKDFRGSVERFRSTATDALQFIEEVSPTTL